MKKLIAIFALLVSITAFSQDKITINNSEISIPIGHKIIVKADIKGNKIQHFDTIATSPIKDVVNFLDLTETFKKDSITDNSIEISFSPADMLSNRIFLLSVIQKTGKILNYKVKIKFHSQNDYTSVIKASSVSNTLSMEQWNDKIDSVILYDFEVTDKLLK